MGKSLIKRAYAWDFVVTNIPNLSRDILAKAAACENTSLKSVARAHSAILTNC
jgi:hypothetical protein